MIVEQSAWRNVTGDTLVARNPCLLHGVVLLTSAGGGDVTIYEGQDATSGEKILSIEGANNISNQVAFNPPLPLQRGLYVDVGSNVSEVLVHFTLLGKDALFADQ